MWEKSLSPIDISRRDRAELVRVQYGVLTILIAFIATISRKMGAVICPCALNAS